MILINDFMQSKAIFAKSLEKWSVWSYSGVSGILAGVKNGRLGWIDYGNY